MARFHSVTWQDGDFERTASILSFDSKAARDAYTSQCPQRVAPIDHAKMTKLLSEGRSQRLLLWDQADPINFRQAAL